MDDLKMAFKAAIRGILGYLFSGPSLRDGPINT